MLRPWSGPWKFAPTAALQGSTLRLWLPRAFRSAEGPNGRDWRRRSRAAQEWKRLVDQALEQLGEARPRWPRVRLHYDVYGRVEIDPDNLVGLGKPVLDGLVAGGVLPDDRAAQVARVDATWLRTPLPWAFVVVTATRVA